MFDDIKDDLLHFIILYGVLWFIFTALETIFPHKNKPIFTRVFWSEVALGIFNTIVINPLNKMLSVLLILYFLTPYIPFQIFNDIIQTWPFYLQILCALLFMDGITYIRHKFTHYYMWDFHAVHHAASYLRSSVQLRMHPVDYIIGSLFVVVILHVIGFDGHAIAWAAYIITIYSMWTHVNIDLDYPSFFRYILASPNYHKWHHDKGIEGKDKNFVVMFPFFDYLGKSYYSPKNALPQHYGVAGTNKEGPLYQSLWGALIYPFKKIWLSLSKTKS